MHVHLCILDHFYIHLILGGLEEPDGPGELVFISYKWTDDRKQKKLADDLHGELKKKDITVFKDDEVIYSGDQLSEKISTAIDNCKIFLCILSKEYYESIWCPKEFKYAFKEKKELFPICWGDNEIPREYVFMLGDQFRHNYNPQAVDPEEEFKRCTDSLMKFIQSEFFNKF